MQVVRACTPSSMQHKGSKAMTSSSVPAFVVEKGMRVTGRAPQLCYESEEIEREQEQRASGIQVA